MIYASLSVIALCLAIVTARFAGRRPGVRRALVMGVAAGGLGLVLWFGLNRITGAGINDAVFYHLATGLEGGDISQYAGLIGAAVAGVLVLLYGCFRLDRWLGRVAVARRWGDAGVLALLVGSAALNPFVTDLGRYAARQYLVVQQTEGFADASLGAVPARRKNLVFLYLESVERSYFDEAVFPGLIEDLRPIEAGAQSFTDVGQSVGAGFTIGGMVAGQCGVPLLLSGAENSMQVSRFLTGATCLGDLLDQAGYRTEYLGGSSKEFAGKGSFYESHGFDQVTGLEDLQAGLEDPAYLGPWGVQDDTLFDVAGKKLQTLAQGADPFALVMLTLDTHHPDGHANTNRACRDVVYGDGSNAMLTSVKCADRLAARFITSILQSPMAEDTVIVVASDHLAMVNGAADGLAQTKRSNLFFILEPGAAPAQIARKASTLDIGATVMAALGFEAGQIGFGVNLFGDAPTLAEQQPDPARADMFADYLAGFQAVYTRLWDYPKINDGFYVNVEAQEVQFGAASFKFPALMQVDETGALQDVTMGDPQSEQTLAGKVLDGPGDVPLLWLDDCATLMPLVNGAAQAGACVLSGAMGAENLAVRSLTGSDFIARDQVMVAADAVDGAVLAQRQAVLRAGLVAQGALPRDVAMDAAGYLGRDVLIRSVTAGKGASLVRLLTTERLDTGADVVLGRGISLVGIAADGRLALLAQADTCAPDAGGVADFKAAMVGDYPAFVVVAHDSAVCEAGLAPVQAALRGLDLPLAAGLGFRQPYIAVVQNGRVTEEVLGREGEKLMIRLRKGAATEPVVQGPVVSVADAVVADAPRGCVMPPEVAAPGDPLGPMQAGVAYPMAAGSAPVVVPGQGWWQAEVGGQWIGANRAQMTVMLPEGDAPRLQIAGIPYRQAEAPFEVWAGDDMLGRAVLAEGRAAVIDLARLPKRVPVDLTLVFADAPPRCPLGEGTADDARALVAMVQEVALQAGPPRLAGLAADASICALPPIATGTEASQPLQLGVPNWISAAGGFGFGAGWWAEEPFGRWIGAQSADISVIFPDTTEALEVEMTGAVFASDTGRMEVRHDGRVVASGLFGAGRPMVFALGDVPRGVPVVLQLRFPDAVPTCPKAVGQFGDDRRLVAMLEAVTLRPRAPVPGVLPSVAHAGGEVGKTRITNSLDALNANQDQYEMFEIDLAWTADGQLVCLHDWQDSFDFRFGFTPAAPLTLAAFEALLADGRPKNCTLHSLANWMQRHPEKRVVTDIKDDNLKGLALIAQTYPALRGQFVPQAYQPDEIAGIKALGFQDVIWTLYQFGGDAASVLDHLAQNGVFALTMPQDRAETGLAQQVFDRLGVQSYVHTVNDAHQAGCFANLGLAGVYTDVLRGPFPGRKGRATDSCAAENG